ncbi:MAG: peptidoglycan recognition family protein [Myxococcota bacterium]
MDERITRWWLGGVLALAPGVAMAHTSELTPDTEREDHHHRPPEYDDPTLAVPPASGADPEYPLAVAFVPAHASNYTANGITDVEYVVVHTMQGYYAGSMSWFQNPSANVSAHYVMRSEDGEITQMVRHADRAWHVGGSNAVALGIEHEGFIAEPQWYTWETYRSSAQLARWLCDEHGLPIDREHVVGHVELPNQTHTDPGALWDWELYMALVGDVVPQGRVEGVVIDRSMACTVTATADTWVKATIEDAADLEDTARCPVDAGTQLTYLHASTPMVGHARLHFDVEGSPCAGDLAREGFVWLGDLEGICEPQAMAAAGALVSLDGGVPVPVDALGHFALDGIAPGAYALDASGDDYGADMVPVDVEIYPGTRVVIGLDPQPGGAETTGGDPDPDPDSGTGGDLPGGTSPGSDGASATSSAEPDTGGSRGLPPGFGEGQDPGCGCIQGSRPRLAWLWPWLLLGLARRRAD